MLWMRPGAQKNLANVLLSAAIIVAALVYGRDVLMPLALAAILAFMLTPLVFFLTRHGVSRALAVGVVLIGFMGAASVASVVFSAQILELTAGLSTYRENFEKKAALLRSSGTESSVLGRALSSIEALRRIVNPPAPKIEGERAQARVMVETAPRSATSMVFDAVMNVFGPLETLLLTLVYTAVLLVEHYDIRDRLVRFAGLEHLSATTSALSEAGERLSRYFLAQGGSNALFGLTVAVVLGAIGVPNPALWGIATFLLRFIPYVGILFAAIPPALLAAAVDPGWSLLLITVGLFAFCEFALSNFLEPMLYGRQTGLSTFAIFAAGSFWSVVWGPVGLLLSAPLTMCLVVLGEYAPALQPLSLILGNRPPLAPDQEYYHRLLSNDQPAASEAVETALESQSYVQVVDRIVLPTLGLAALDHKAGKIDADILESIRAATRAAGDILLSSISPEQTAASAGDAEGERSVVVTAHGPVDAMLGPFLAALVAHVTGRECRAVEQASGMLALAGLKSQGGAGSEPRTLLVVGVGGVTPKQMRLLAQRAAAMFSEARVLLCDWRAAPAGPETSRDSLPARVVECANFAQAIELLKFPSQAPAPEAQDADLLGPQGVVRAA